MDETVPFTGTIDSNLSGFINVKAWIPQQPTGFPTHLDKHCNGKRSAWIPQMLISERDSQRKPDESSDPDLFDVLEKNVNGGFHQRTQWILDPRHSLYRNSGTWSLWADSMELLMDETVPFTGTIDHNLSGLINVEAWIPQQPTGFPTHLDKHCNGKRSAWIPQMLISERDSQRKPDESSYVGPARAWL